MNICMYIEFKLIYLRKKILTHFLFASSKFKSVYATSCMMNSFPSYNPFPHRGNVVSFWLFYRHFHGMYFDEQHSLVPPAQIFATGIRHVTCAWMNHPHLPSYSIGNKELPFGQILPKKLWNELPTGCFPIFTILTSSSLGLLVIFPA